MYLTHKLKQRKRVQSQHLQLISDYPQCLQEEEYRLAPE